ncbi:hypothetical protein BJX70DRAFT_358972 [Aspergillus crustosus]
MAEGRLRLAEYIVQPPLYITWTPSESYRIACKIPFNTVTFLRAAIYIYITLGQLAHPMMSSALNMKPQRETFNRQG